MYDIVAVNSAECIVMDGRSFGLNWPLPTTVNRFHDTIFYQCQVYTVNHWSFPVDAPPRGFTNDEFLLGRPATAPSVFTTNSSVGYLFTVT